VPLFIYKNMEGFAAALEAFIAETLRQGLYGWQVTDCTVSLVRSGYSVPDGGPSTRGPLSGPQDFRKLTPLVVMAALKRAGTVVCEPIHHFRLETPADTLNVLLPVLARLQAVASVAATNDSWCTVEGDIPVARVHELRQQIPPLTRGEGVARCRRAHPSCAAAPQPACAAARRRAEAPRLGGGPLRDSAPPPKPVPRLRRDSVAVSLIPQDATVAPGPMPSYVTARLLRIPPASYHF
jgi:translation elongation factor EF-G